MRELRVIRQPEAAHIESLWNPHGSNKNLTSKYVLLPDSLKFFKRIGTQIDSIFKSNLCTRFEYCTRYKGYFLVNDYVMKIEQSSEDAETLLIKVIDRSDYHTLRCVETNKYILKTYANLYGHKVLNTEYLAAFKLVYRQERDVTSVYSYEVVATDGYTLKYIPYSRVMYEDGSMETYRGTIVTDVYKESAFYGKIQTNSFYCKDLLTSEGYRQISTESPFKEG